MAIYDGTNLDLVESLLLNFDTINPIQWLTNNFMHADIMHLLGNMFFLWGFGLVVEGKLGWWRFLLVYLFIGIVYGAFIQIFMFLLGAYGAALGASAAIYGLIGIAIVWAPKNDMNCILLLGIFSRTVSPTISTFGMFYLGFQLLGFALRGFSMSSEALHLTGLAIGFPLGVLFLKKKWVDCENWDLFTIWQGKQSRMASEIGAKTDTEELAAAEQDRHESNQAMVANSIRSALNAGNASVALAMFNKQKDLVPDFTIPQKVHLALISGLHKQDKFHDSITLMEDFLKKHPDHAALRIRFAQILVQHEDRPHQAIRLLKSLPADVSDDHKKRARAIYRVAKKAIEEGAIELQD